MNTIYLRRAKQTDLDAIMVIINDAKAYLKAQQIPQWQDGHPDQAAIEHDITTQTGWVLISNAQIAGYAALQLTPEPTYQKLQGGKWSQPNQPYATIHRVAISQHFRGQHLSSMLFTNLLTVGQMQDINNFRIDTHPANQGMQHVVSNCGFKQRGTILINDQCDPHRIAYELNLGDHQRLTQVNNDFMQSLIDNLPK